MTATNEAKETLASTVFIKEHTVQSIAINAYDLVTANKDNILSIQEDDDTPCILLRDKARYKNKIIPEAFKTLNFHILILKNEMVVVGHSDLARIEEYDLELGKRYALENAIDIAYSFIAGQVKEDRSDTPLLPQANQIVNELMPTATPSMDDPCFEIYPMNLGHALGYLFGINEINHTLRDVALTLLVLKSNNYTTYGYHQAPTHEDFDEGQYRKLASVDALVRIKNIRLMIAKTNQMKKLEA